MTDHEYMQTLTKALEVLANDPAMPHQQVIRIYLNKLEKSVGKQIGKAQLQVRITNIQEFMQEYLKDSLEDFGVRGNLNKKNKTFINFLEKSMTKTN